MPRVEEQGELQLKELSHEETDRNLYETIEGDYDVYDSPAVDEIYDEVQAPNSPHAQQEHVQPSSSTGKFELTHCPAYDSVATTRIHSSSRK